MMNNKISEDRLAILQKIEDYERSGLFDLDVEDDPPTIPLKPDDVDYLNKKLINKIKTFTSNIVGTAFFNSWLKNKKVILSDVLGLENLKDLKGGAIVTCNHFNIFDNYAVYLALKKYYKRLTLYKIIREGNYNMAGKVGYILRHSNTLPLSENQSTMLKLLKSVKELLKRKKLVLMYPEQGMWWNYRKIRPFKTGAFRIAVKNSVPVVPLFITLNDSEILGDDGYPVQEYTVHIMPIITADSSLSDKENIENMKNANYNLCKAKYEEVYKKEMVYLKSE